MLSLESWGVVPSHFNLGRIMIVLTNKQDINSSIFQGQVVSYYISPIWLFSLNGIVCSQSSFQGSLYKDTYNIN